MEKVATDGCCSHDGGGGVAACNWRNSSSKENAGMWDSSGYLNDAVEGLMRRMRGMRTG